MCCSEEDVLDVPPEVIEMLARYRHLQRTQGFGWGEEALPDFFAWSRFSLLGPAFDEFAATGDWAGAVRAAIGDAGPPAGVLVVQLGPDACTVTAGPPLVGLAGDARDVDVIVLADPDVDGAVTVEGHEVRVDAGGAGVRTVPVDPGDGAVTIGDRHGSRTVACATASESGTLRLEAPSCARWSVVDAQGKGWFPDDAVRKWDVDHRPYFHTDAVRLTLPVGEWTVVAARGIEFQRQTWTVQVGAGNETVVRWEPVRRFDPAGWHSADLHVHLNYSGDHVLDPADAHRMQVGEGLALMVLQAGNLTGPLVYDRELLDATGGEPLWHAHDHTAVAGHEFRNDLLGHVHGLGLHGLLDPPFTGTEGTDHPYDWPPNAAACAQLRDDGALVTYAHPSYSALEEVEQLYSPARTVEARELVADAALGLVDTVEVVSCFDDAGAVRLWHHLLNCGLRLTATAGSDVFLSFAHGPTVASNPPGWGRMYAHLGDEPLTAAAYQDAVARGRTVVTNGPWLTLDVGGAMPGDTVDLAGVQSLRARATVTGSGVDRLVLYGPDGELAATDQDTLELDLTLDAPGWIAAAAHGGTDEHTLGAPVFAHTTPVYLDLDGRRVARPESADWCLRALDLLEELVSEHGRFDPATRADQLADLQRVIDPARAFYRSVARS